MMSSDRERGPRTDPVAIYRYRDGLYAADLLTAGLVWLDFFSWLADHPSDKSGICRQFATHDRPTDVMLTLFAAMGLVESREGVFRLTATAREHLVKSSRWFIGPYYASLADRPVCKDFVEVLRTDKVANWGGLRNESDWHEAMEGEAFARRFTAAMDCRGVYLGEGLAPTVSLELHAHVLDVAGGSGVYVCSLLAAYPHLRATVLEKPPVDKVALEAIAERGCSDRISVVAADMLHDPWPLGSDVHLLSNVLHDWPEPTVRQLLACSFAALPAGGMLIIHDAFINAEKDGPLAVAEYSALLMHSTQGKCYSVREYGSFLELAGFVDISYAPTVADRGRMIAHKPRRSPPAAEADRCQLAP